MNAPLRPRDHRSEKNQSCRSQPDPFDVTVEGRIHRLNSPNSSPNRLQRRCNNAIHGNRQGQRVRFSGTKRTVVDGPFSETKELIAGFWLWQVRSMEEAVEWVKRCPNPHERESEIEIRRVFEVDDFGPQLTPELREQEERLRAETAKKK